MKLKFFNLLKQGGSAKKTGFSSESFDPSGSYTGNYLSLDGELERPEQDADDL